MQLISYGNSYGIMPRRPVFSNRGASRDVLTVFSAVPSQLPHSKYTCISTPFILFGLKLHNHNGQSQMLSYMSVELSQSYIFWVFCISFNYLLLIERLFLNKTDKMV